MTDTPPEQAAVRDFEYQRLGIRFLTDRNAGLLADEMGLGKTFQAISAARELVREGKVKSVLIVCPRILISNWRREFERFWPGAGVRALGPGEDRRAFLRLKAPWATVKLMHYEALAREYRWIRTSPVSHDLVILDEAHLICNSGSLTSRAARSLRAERRWAITGTPLANRRGDIGALLGFLQAGTAAPPSGLFLDEILQGMMIRRRAADVAIELPPLVDCDVLLDLTDQQRAEYRRAERRGVTELETIDPAERYDHILGLIPRLQRVCNLAEHCGESVKFDRLQGELLQLQEVGEKAIVFSQFVTECGLEWLRDSLAKHGVRAMLLSGKVPLGERQRVLDGFQHAEGAAVLLLGYKLGAGCLNLQHARHVFLFDRPWNPAVEDQAVKRVHRLGQTGTVFVHRFVCAATVEERILSLQRSKRSLFNSLIDRRDNEEIDASVLDLPNLLFADTGPDA